MERAVAPLLLQRRASGRRALSRLRAPLRHRDPSGRHQHRHHLRRHLRPRAHRCRTRGQHAGEKRMALTSLIHFRLLARLYRTQDRVQEPRMVPVILIRRYRGERR